MLRPPARTTAESGFGGRSVRSAHDPAAPGGPLLRWAKWVRLQGTIGPGLVVVHPRTSAREDRVVILRLMAVRNGPLDRARETSKRLTTYSVAEIHVARLSAGLSQQALGAAVGLTASEVGRFERGDLQDVGIDRLCRMAAAVGLTVSLRLYPAGDPVRDAGQSRLLDRLRGHVPPRSRWRQEVPLRGRDDARAWDAVIDGTGCADAVEAETRFVDTQATERRIALKLRDDPSVAHVVLLLADTRLNRRTLAAVRDSLLATYPIDARVALARIADGRCPGGNAIVVL